MRLVVFLALVAGFNAGCSRPSAGECSADSNCPAGARCADGLCSNVGVSCSDILRMGASAGDGQYVIRPGGGDAFTAWCDMTTDGGGWTLLGWSGDLGAVPPSGIPYPGLSPCSTLDCARGSAASRSQLEALIRSSTEFGKGLTAIATTGGPGYLPELGLYDQVGKYTYGSLGAVNLPSTPGTCNETGQLEGWFRTLVGPNDYDNLPVHLNLELATGSYDYTSDAAANPYIFTIGAPGGGCTAASGSAMPGSWMGNFPPDYGPYQAATSGASSLWVRGDTQPAPPISCKEIKDSGSPRGDGLYWIGSGTGSVFQVRCDMTTDGGGWTVVYYVDADHFDGVAANNDVASSLVPTSPSSPDVQSDIWNAEASLAFSQTLFACTTQNQAAKYFWRYDSANPFTWYAGTTNYGNGYQNSTYSDVDSGIARASCLATDKAVPGSTHGFLVLGSRTTCLECDNILFGMYDYTDSQNCNATYSLLGGHISPWDPTRTITYPVCNGQQTSNGLFWIAVR